MNAIQTIQTEAEHAFKGFLSAIEGVDEKLSWATAPLHEGEYLHNNASILGMVQHVAGCKIMYASAGFKNTEVRWRDVVTRLEEIASDWQKTIEYLHESQIYWLSSWQNLNDEDLTSVAKTNWGETWPIWKIIHTITAHDAYHAGQIALLKTILSPTSTPPQSMAEMTKTYLADSPSW